MEIKLILLGFLLLALLQKLNVSIFQFASRDIRYKNCGSPKKPKPCQLTVPTLESHLKLKVIIVIFVCNLDRLWSRFNLFEFPLFFRYQSVLSRWQLPWRLSLLQEKLIFSRWFYFISFTFVSLIKHSSLQATDMSKVVSPEREPPIKNNNEDSAEENEVN